MKKAKKILLVLAAALLLSAAIIADSRFRLTVTEYDISSERLPGSFDGFRIVQLSDIHGMSFGKDNRRLVEKIRLLEPDMIAVTGDMVDENTDMELIDSLLARLTELAPVYYVSGNHEWGSGRIAELEPILKSHDVRYLKNEYELLSRGESSILIAGVEDPNSWSDMIRPDELMEKASDEYPGLFRLFLAHRNYWAWQYPGLKADAVLCGHGHGGIIRIPFLGGLVGSGYRLFPEYTEGEYTLENYTLIISRGLGNSVALPRFLNNPEIVAVTLRSK